MTRVRNDLFDPRLGFHRGRSRFVEGLWYLTKMVFFLSAFPWPSTLKAFLLRRFGATVGKGVCIKPRVNVHLPWRLSLGDFSWVGEEVFLLNLEQIQIGKHCCISQRAFLCTGNHDFKEPDMRYRNRAITVNDGAWVGGNSVVGPGVVIGVDTVVAMGSIVTADLPDGMICAGNPCKPLKPRWETKT